MSYDNRPPRGGWAPGGHYRTCLKCLNTYLGSQSSLRCADCAYSMENIAASMPPASDHPRTDAVLAAHDMSPEPKALIKHAQDLERELNEASSTIRQQQLLDEEILRLNARIKRLEEAGNEVIWWFCPKDTSLISSMQSAAAKRWNAAKEAKP